MAYVDTGADACVFPRAQIEQLGAKSRDRKFMLSILGERRLVDVYVFDIAIGNQRFLSVTSIADERGPDAILGRSFLNKLVMTLNGPQRFLEILD
jgi:predicted aspartyl protease